MTEISVGRYDSTKDKVFAPEHKLLETKNFNVVADDNPLVEGHILIIPKENISCVGEFSDELLTEFGQLYDQTSDFLQKSYGLVSTFEHGKIGQTIYHAHVHLLPYEGDVKSIIPEGENNLTKINTMQDVQNAYKQGGQYLFLSVGDDKWLVDPKLGYPRFFRDRFATALGMEGQGDWQKMKDDPIMKQINQLRIQNLEKKWNSYAR